MRLSGQLVMFAAMASLLAAAPAQARSHSGRFHHPADADKDERITRAEWLASGEDATGFRSADVNRDGAVTGPEFARWFMAKEGIAPVAASARQPASPVDRLVERR